MPIINMRSTASKIKGQGVGSCFEEQLRLVSEGLDGSYKIQVNSLKNSDIIHYHTVNLPYYLERVLRRNKISAIGYVHFLPDTLEESLDLPASFKKLFNKYLLAFYNSMDYLVIVNPAIAAKLEAYGVRRPEIVYIPNYVSEKEFYIQSKEQTALTKVYYDLPEDQFIVMGVGQLQTRKGVTDFIKTAEALPHIQFVWAGGFSFGKISDGYEKIQMYVKNPPKNVKFLGIVDRNRMVDLYNACDLLFLPSYDELFPMAILEALCCKKPVLLRDLDIYSDILLDCHLRGNNPEQFLQSIETLRTDPAAYRYWQNKAWECHRYYTEEHILEMWRALYSKAYRRKEQQEVFVEEG